MFREIDLVMNIGFLFVDKPELVTDPDLGYYLHLVADLDLV